MRDKIFDKKMKKKFLLLFVLITCSSLSKAQCLVSGSASLGDLEFYTNAVPADKRIIQEIIRIESMFKVRANVMYSKEQEVNAHAYNDKSLGLDGIIVINDGLLKFLDGKDYLVLAAILAHEYGHLLQYKWGFYQFRLSDKQIELFADYLSGVYMNYRIGETNFNPSNKNSGGATLLKQINIYDEFGNDLGDESFGTDDPHGTAKERSDALMSCFRDGLREISYIENHRAKLNNEYFYSIYTDGSWWSIAEYYYRIGLRTIHDKF